MGLTREGVPKLFNTSGSQPVRIDFRDCLCRGNDDRSGQKELEADDQKRDGDEYRH